MSQAAIYCRISEDRTGAGLGVERQEEDCRKLAAQLGVSIADVYVDNDISAYKRSARRPRKDYNRMLDDAQAGRFSVILSWHTDRLHRSNVELEHFIDICQPRNIPTHTVKAGQLDLTTPGGRLVARQLGLLAQYQSEHMAEQVQRAKEQRVMNGGNAGGPRPFGFEADGRTLRASEAAEIRHATRAVLDGESLSSLTRNLNRRGIRTTQGNSWTVASLRTMLLRPRNAGILVYQGKEAGEAPWPAIVPELTWRQMKAVFADPARRTAQSNRVGSLGSGLYRCGICGSVLKISASGAGSKVRGYRCAAHNHLTQAAIPLDAYVERHIKFIMSQPEFREAAEAEAARLAGGAGDREGQIRAAEARLAELGELFAAGDIDARTLKAGTEKLRAQIAEAEQGLGASVARRPVDKLIAMNPADDWDRMPLSVRREILAALAVVTVNPAKVRGGRFDPGRVVIRWTWEQ